MNTNHDLHNIRLTASEVSELWMTYLNNSASKCVLSYFKNKTVDGDIRAIVEFALEMSEMHLNAISNVFKTINHPLPYGFKDKDVNVNAEKLFSDEFMLFYLKHMARFSFSNYGEALSVCAREDVRAFFTNCLQSTIQLSNKTDDLLLSKGLYVRAPYIDVPERTEFVHKQSYIHGLLGDKRPINASEITQIYINMQTNYIGKAFAMGLSQTIKDDRVRDFILRGKEIAEKHVAVFSEMLKMEDLPAPMSHDSDVLGSTEPPFSDSLIMFHFTGLNAFSIALYANSMVKIMRTDILASFARLSAEITQYAKDGIDIMIDNEWLEKTPEKVSHEVLISK